MAHYNSGVHPTRAWVFGMAEIGDHGPGECTPHARGCLVQKDAAKLRAQVHPTRAWVFGARATSTWCCHPCTPHARGCLAVGIRGGIA